MLSKMTVQVERGAEHDGCLRRTTTKVNAVGVAGLTGTNGTGGSERDRAEASGASGRYRSVHQARLYGPDGRSNYETAVFTGQSGKKDGTVRCEQ